MHGCMHACMHTYVYTYIHIAKTAADAAVASSKLKKEQNATSAMSAITSAEAAARVREAEDGARVAREVC
jgi:hypothetical protein